MCLVTKEIEVVPKYILYNNKNFKIVKILDSDFKISECLIKINNNNVDDIFVNGYHPNCNPTTGQLCKSEIHGKPYIQNITLDKLINILNIYNLESCYFKPWDKLIIKEI